MALVSENGGAVRWVLSGGGTGGHVMPALALGEELREQGQTVLFLGGERGLEGELVPAAGFELLRLPARPVAGRGRAAQIGALATLIRATVRALQTLRRRRAEIVISVGGYAAVPAVLGALALRLPVAVVEPNAVPGRAHRLLARFARRVFVAFDATAARFGRAVRVDRVRTVGVPLRRALVESFRDAPPRRVPTAPFRLLIFGGSQGARQLNEALLDALPGLDPARLAIVHQTGAADRDRVAAAYASAGFDAEVVAFEPDLPRRYRWADLALCRAGALTVAELALAGLPALLVPYPYAADDHQRVNARELEHAGAARVLDPATFNGERLAEALAAAWEDPVRLREMGDRAAKLARPDAARRVIDECRVCAGR